MLIIRGRLSETQRLSFVFSLNPSSALSPRQYREVEDESSALGSTEQEKMRYTKEQGVGEGVSANPSKPMLRKGVWTPEEDEKLVNYIRKNDNLGGWSYVAKQAGLLRCGKSCRLRWLNYLRPGQARGIFIPRRETDYILAIPFRWSLMATKLPGRTDNDVKNYWNSFIKKKLKLKHHLSCSSKSKSNTESNIPSHSTTKTVSVHGPDAFTSSHSSQQYMVVVPERSQTPNNAFNVVTTGKNLLTLEGVLQLKNEQVQDQSDHEFSIDPNPTKNQQISYPNLWTNASSINIHESFSSPAAFISPCLHAKSPTCDQLIIESCRTTVPPLESLRFADFSLGSTGINIPCLVESDSSEEKLEKLENDENHIMINYSSNANDSSDVVDRGAYGSYEAGISILEKYGSLYENTTHQSCQLLDPVYQFSWPAGKFSEIQSQDDCKARLNLGYNVNLGGPAYIDSNSRCETYQLPFIEEPVKANRIPTLLGRREESGLFETEYCKGGTEQITAWAHDDIYNTDNADPSDHLNHI